MGELTELSEKERADALHRFKVIQRIKDSWDAVQKQSPKKSCGAFHNPELN